MWDEQGPSLVVCSSSKPRSLLKHVIHLTHVNVWESMGKPCSCMQFIKIYYKSCKNPYQVLQVTCAASVQ